MKIITSIKNLDNHQLYLLVCQTVENFLQKRGYLKIDLPLMSPALIPESYLEVFETEFKYLGKKENLYLIPSPELFLKRILAYGKVNCYFLGKSFRNSELPSNLHSPEFTMLEFYKIGANYLDLADEILEMLRNINEKLKTKKSKLKTLRKKLNFDRWEKITVSQAFKKYAQVTEEELFNHQLFIKKAKEKGYQTDGFSYEEIWSQIYSQEIEPHLGKNGYPTLIYDYPKEFAATAKLNLDGKTSQRFEFYINGIELGDCYTELTDWKEQKKRFAIEEKKRIRDKKINHPVDNGFIKALKYGLPPCAGIAIGVERLTMVMLGLTSIEDLKLINYEN
jgi:elongation factor P--beta-lysine ligase